MIEFRRIRKTFGGVVALDGVSLSIIRGQCHALVGENGAGKSTLAKILAGLHRPDSGEIRIDGRVTRFASARDAAGLGIGMVHQELAYCPDLSVAENLCLGRYPRRWGFLLDRPGMSREAHRKLESIGGHATTLDTRAPMRCLSTAHVQLVQIAAAVGAGARILIFDEPTSSLSESESEQLFALIERLREQHVTMIYVSHRMPEVFRLADRISVLRDGRHVGVLDRSDADEDRLVRMMVGRALAPRLGADRRLPGAPERPTVPESAAARIDALRVDGLHSPGRFDAVSFAIQPGEIVGFAGLVGSGRSEVAQAIFGLDRAARGRVTVAGQPLRLGSSLAALRLGVGLVPEDRKRQGLVLIGSCRTNFSLAILDQLRRFGLLDRRRERREAAEFFRRLDVRTPSLETPVTNLSGGNQQKVVLARWLARRLRVLIVDEPTRGVDVTAKAAIHDLLNDLAQRGLAILLISSELPEVLQMSDRILVMRGGRLVAEVPRAQAAQDGLMRLMAGV